MGFLWPQFLKLLFSKSHIGFSALYSQSDYLDKLETHQVACRGQ